MSEQDWSARTGQIETVLSYFGSTCSISVERADGVTVYVQARREDDRLEVEAISDTHLPSRARLTGADRAAMAELGWAAPEPPDLPNFTRSAGNCDDLSAVAAVLATTLKDVYRVSATDTWVVYPPEFALGEDLAGFEVMDLDDTGTTDEHAGVDAVEDDFTLRTATVTEDGPSAVDAFSPYVQEQLGWYVYLLRDPRDDTVFYVGKGKGNRVFDHARAALGADGPSSQSLKLDRIRAIHRAGLAVRTEILRHNIANEALAYTVEAAVIDTFRALGTPLTNTVLGHRHALHGWASTGTVASIYDAPALPEVNEPILLLKIPQLWTPAMSDREIFEATRGWWTVGTRALAARYALAVSKGVSRAAYRIEYWRERVPGDRDYSAQDSGRRLGFWGSAAPELRHLINKNIARVPQPSGGSFVYLNVDPRAPSLAPLYRADQAREKARQETFPSRD